MVQVTQIIKIPFQIIKFTKDDSTSRVKNWMIAIYSKPIEILHFIIIKTEILATSFNSDKNLF